MKQQNFSAEFKAQIVIELLSGIRSDIELCRRYQIQLQTLLWWKKVFLEHAPKVFETLQTQTSARPVVEIPEALPFTVQTLSVREIDIVKYIVLGMRDKEIADSLDITESTVKWYIKKIYSKFDVHSRSELIIKVQMYEKSGYQVDSLL